MKDYFKTVLLCLAGLLCFMAGGLKVEAADTIKQGVYADELDLSGMTEAEARQALNDHIDELKAVEFTLIGADAHQITVTAGDMGLAWTNIDIPTQAVGLGTEGNVIQRYKIKKDMERHPYVFEIDLDANQLMITNILEEQLVQYDRDAKDYSMIRVDNEFQIEEGNTGLHLDVEASVAMIFDYIVNDWDGTATEMNMILDVTEPRGSLEELSEVVDVLGEFTTSFKSSGADRSANVTNGCQLINGTLLYPGDEFSTYSTVSPFSEANGYHMAGSYVNGKVVDSLGGGICQVSTTLYNAVLLAELDVTMRYNHSMIISYVQPSMDAAIAESSGKDFRFVNSTDHPIYIEGSVDSKKNIKFVIYGKEYRDPSHSVAYESEVLETTVPETDTIYLDAGQPIGYIVTQSAHIGYKAKLWKITYENGEEVSREAINKSTYTMSPASATVGVATSDPNAYNEMVAAAGMGSIQHMRDVIAILTAPAAQP